MESGAGVNPIFSYSWHRHQLPYVHVCVGCCPHPFPCVLFFLSEEGELLFACLCRELQDAWKSSHSMS